VEKTDKYKTVMQICDDYGYEIAKYFYSTEDKYINCVYRVKKGGGKQPVVVYQHGLLDSCAGVLMCGKDSLAFYLVDRGFEVWLNNSRGNRHSKHHSHLDPAAHEQYWDFSFQEMAQFDVPALITLVIEKSQTSSVSYIGHS
jgi:lysosomal acid lipase/cholesteryl ester hydrolase